MAPVKQPSSVASTGIAVPDKGSVCFDDQEFRRDQMELRRRMYFLPDFPFHFWEQSVLRNVAIVLRLFDLDGPAAEERVLALLNDFDLPLLALRPVNSLSSRPGIQGWGWSRCWRPIAKFGCWMNLSPRAWTRKVLTHLNSTRRRAAGRGRTIIYSTQLLDVAERFSDRVCVIHKGELHAFDTLTATCVGMQAQDKDNVLEEMFRHLRETNR